MDFEFTDDQLLLKQTIERFVTDHYSFEQRRESLLRGDGGSSPRWQQFAAQGLLALPFAVDDGGLGLGTVETMIVMEALGKALVLEPYLTTVVLCGGLLRHGASPAQRAALIPAIAGGELTLAFAHGERHARYELGHVETRATPTQDGWRIDGQKCVVLHGDRADRLIVSARIAGDSREAEGIALFMVEGNTAGVVRHGYATQDGLRAADIIFSGVQLNADALLGPAGQALPIITRAVDATIAALCAEAVGIMAETLALTVEYLKTRKQFGVAIGSFQVLQHRAADMFVMLEQARSMAMFATIMVDSEDAVERRRAISAAKIQINRSARFIGQQAVQLHGGIGITMEHVIAHYFKRLTVIETMFGDVEHHLVQLADAGGLINTRNDI